VARGRGTIGVMRFLGIDYGRKRVGVALSDETGTLAFPHSVLANNDTLVERLAELVTKQQVGTIVIGHSKDKTGHDNPVQTAITELVADLTLATGLPVALEPEQYSTQEALREQGRTAKTDAAAAAIILNSYLTRHAAEYEQ